MNLGRLVSERTRASARKHTMMTVNARRTLWRWKEEMRCKLQEDKKLEMRRKTQPQDVGPRGSTPGSRVANLRR